jgi:hypothetical protein
LGEATNVPQGTHRAQSALPKQYHVKGETTVTIERYLRLIAGIFVLASLLLGYYVSPYWFLLTGFVALNLIQSAFTNWCPMMTFLRRLGAREEGARGVLRTN